MPNEKQINFSGFQHLYPFKSNYLNINGFRYHYLDEGKGNPIVMLHGNPTWSFYYRQMVKVLSLKYRTIVPDHIGCGLSDKPGPKHYNYRLQNRVKDLEALLAYLEVKKKKIPVSDQTLAGNRLIKKINRQVFNCTYPREPALESN